MKHKMKVIWGYAAEYCHQLCCDKGLAESRRTNIAGGKWKCNYPCYEATHINISDIIQIYLFLPSRNTRRAGRKSALRTTEG